MEHKENYTVNPEPMKYNKIIFKVTLASGEVIYPAYLDENDVNLKQKISDSMDYFQHKYSGLGQIETVIDPLLFDVIDTKSWDAYRKEMFENESDDKVKKVLKFLTTLWISPRTIDIVSKDLQYQDNEKLLMTYIDLSDYSDVEKQKVKDTIILCKSAHLGQTQQRPQDTDGLSSIPYSNHPVQVAIMAIRDLKMTPNEVMACLLHDTVEDTQIRQQANTLFTDSISLSYDDEVFSLIDDCTKKETESREEFMIRMSQLKWSSKLIKCLDRYHNLVRAFTINDPKYTAKILKETQEVYMKEFDNNPRLLPLQYMFFELLEELKKYEILIKKS